MKEKLKIIPLGGLNEIGKNMTVIEYGNEVFDLIDVQITRPDVLAPPFPLSPEF